MQRVVTIVLFYLTAFVTGSVDAAGEKPKVVCEADASGANMVCRDVWLGEDAAPFRRIAPASSAPLGFAPKPSLPMLAPASAREPSAAQAPAYLRKSDASPHVEPALPAPSAPAIVERSASSTATNPPTHSVKPIAKSLPRPPDAVAEGATVTPSTAASAGTTRQEVATTPPAPVSDEPVATTPIISPPPKPALLPAVEPVAAAPQPPTVATAQPPEMAVATPTSRSSALVDLPRVATSAPATPVALLGGADFRALDGSHYTLELANAKSPDSLNELAARLQLAGAVYLIHLRSPEADRWLLAWADHASQNEARSARQQVPADAAINSGWPRRIAPLQNELVSP